MSSDKAYSDQLGELWLLVCKVPPHRAQRARELLLWLLSLDERDEGEHHVALVGAEER